MSKGTDKKATGRDFEDPIADEKSSRRLGLFAMLAILTIVGVAIWLIMNQGEPS